MLGYQGDFTLSNVMYLLFNTFDSNDPSASVTITGLALADIQVYKNGGVTQRSSTAGMALLGTNGIDFDAITGIHGISIDLSDDTDAGFYSTGAEYTIVVASITVDAATINFVLATFSIERVGGVLALVKAGNLSANVVQIGGVTQSATDLKDFVDAGYDPITNKVQGVVLVDTATVLSNLPTIPNNWLTSAGITANALDGKGNWNIGKTGYTLSQAFPGNFASLVITAGGAVDSLVQGFINSVIVESTLGRLADNFDNFYDNADAVTTKVVDDVGGGGAGGTDWTALERSDIRGALGITGTATLGGNTPTLALQSTSDEILEGVGNLASGSAAISIEAESYTLTTGTQSSGTVADTETLNAVYHVHTDAAGTLELYYQFDVGGNGVAVETTFSGRLNSNNDSIGVYAFNWGASSWDQIGTLDGTNGATDTLNTMSYLVRHTGTGADIGKVRLRFFDASLTSATLYIDQIHSSFSVVSESVGYVGGQVWLDTVDGTAGVIPHFNGVADRPSLLLADAIIIANGLSLHRYQVTPDSTIDLVAALVNTVMSSTGAILNLGNQNVSGTHFTLMRVNGIATSPTAEVDFRHCLIGNITIDDSHFINCGLAGTITLNSVSSSVIIASCHSRLAAGLLPVIDFGVGSANHDVSISEYYNGIELRNFNAAVGGGVDTFHMSGIGSITIASSCDGGTVNLRGIWSITDNSGGNVTISYDDITVDVAATLANTVTLGAQNTGIQNSIDTLNDFDPALDTVANVTTVANTTDMRGNDLAPDNAGIANILASVLTIGVTKNQVFNNLEFLMVDVTDNQTPELGLTVTGQRSIDGGTFVAIAGTIAEVGSGIYQADLAAVDTNGDVITYKFSSVAAADTFVTVKTRL